MCQSTAVSPATRTGSRRLTIGLYATAVFLYWIALYLYVPTLPVYVASKTENLALVGVVLSMYGLWQAVIRLPLGITADWLGRRKPFILVGFALAGLGAWTMGAADDVNGLILGRAITGIAAGTWVPLVVAFSGLFPPEEAVRASALLTFIGSVGRMLATGVTGTLNDLGGYSLPFYLAAMAAALAVLILLPNREERRPPKRPSLQGIGRLITRRDVLLPSVLSAVGQYANWAATFGFIPILARQLGATDVMLSMLTSMNIAVLTLGNLATTTLVRRLGARRLVYLSFTLLALGLWGATLAPTLPLVFAAQFCIGLSMGIGYPTLMGLSIQNVTDAERTTAMGLHQAVYAIGMFSGPGLSGTIADAIGIRPMFGITAGVALVLGMFGTKRLR
ncbi:MAG TPA: MFS transporter [Caldilineae bacterium]|jgi:MFS family permease|nr:MFS transporter [Caldilineae bacterium]